MADDNELGTGLFDSLGNAIKGAATEAAGKVAGAVTDAAKKGIEQGINEASDAVITALNNSSGTQNPEQAPTNPTNPADPAEPEAGEGTETEEEKKKRLEEEAKKKKEEEERLQKEKEEKEKKEKEQKEKEEKEKREKEEKEKNEKNEKDTQTSSFMSVPAKATASEMAELNSVQVDTAFANSAFDTLGNLSFDKLIGEPIRAAVKAQRDMAKEALNYIKKETIITGKDGVGQIAYVTLSFTKDGKKTTMQIPLLSLIPYPSLSISSMTYKFTAKVDASSGVAVGVNSADTATLAKIGGGGAASGKDGGGGGGGKPQPTNTGSTSVTATPSAPQKASNTPGLAASLSSKPGSSALRESRYSVETTIDMSVTASTAETPSGITKIMEILDTATEVVDTDGVLDVSAKALTLVDGHAILRASYRDGGGVYRREKIKCSVFEGGTVPKGLSSGDEVLFLFSEKGIYLLEAGDFKELIQVS